MNKNNKPTIIIAEKIPTFYLKITNSRSDSAPALRQKYHLVWIENIQDLIFAIKKHSPSLLIINDNLSALNITDIKEYVLLLKFSLPIIYLCENSNHPQNEKKNKQITYVKKDIEVERIISKIKEFLAF